MADDGVDRRPPWDALPPWGGERRRRLPFKRQMLVRRRPRCPAVRTHAAADRPARRRRVASGSPAGSGSPLHTPGHTDDHLCLFDPTEGVMLSGDHVLPTITPHIGGFVRDADPLQRLLRLARQGRRPLGRRRHRPAGPRPPVRRPRPAGPRRSSEHHVDRLELVRADVRRARVGRRACRSCRRSCSPPGPRARWPTARRSPTSSTCASRRSYRRLDTPAGYRYEPV